MTRKEFLEAFILTALRGGASYWEMQNILDSGIAAWNKINEEM